MGELPLVNPIDGFKQGYNLGHDVIGPALESAGNSIRNFFGFKKGGRVPGKKGKALIAMIHGGEYVLPVGIKPTKAQRKKVNAGKKKKTSK